MRCLDTDPGSQVDMQILDFSKAFDTVSHPKLLQKINHYGIQGTTLHWISTWLTKRNQRVLVDGEMSQPIPVSSGVPQGTVLGPLMFLLYINDIGDRVSSETTIKLFAEDQVQLQKDLDVLKDWSYSWQISFKPSKCHTMQVTRSRQPRAYIYSMLGVHLSSVKQTLYLGVHLSSNMTWNHHINHVVNDASKILGFIRRNLARCDAKVKTAAYKALVRPKLEYAATVWDPHQTYLVDKLEMVQRRAARFVCNDFRRTTSVSELLKSLEWSPLQQRRKDNRLTLFYKTLHHEASVDIPEYVHEAPRSVRENTNRLVPLQCRTKAYLNSFIPNTIRDWNKLPPDVKKLNSTHAFKLCLERKHTLI